MKKFGYKSMGTSWEISVWDDIPQNNFDSVCKEAENLCKSFDQTFSRFIKSSLVTEISKSVGKYKVPEDFMNMLKMYMNLYLPSGKKLNPLIGFTISDLGYDADYSLSPKEVVRKTPDLFDSVKILEDQTIETNKPLLFDLGALGKGYAVDKVSNILKNKGIKRFLVDGSGDVFYQGEEKIKVGLEDPGDNKKIIGVYEMATGAMCASGVNKRKWRDYHHVIDPLASKPTEGVSSTWVIAETTALADALASCLFFAPPENFADFKFEYCVMNQNRQIKNSAGFNAEFFTG